MIVAITLYAFPVQANASRLEKLHEATARTTITITLVPPKGAGPDSMGSIAGTASAANVTQLKVVIFARTNTWYVQPYAASPYTAIAKDGKWKAATHLGDEYAALLVDSSYQPPATTDTLPNLVGPVLAIARVAASVPNVKTHDARNDTTAKVRTIQFSGYEWRVKSSSERVGPGPNYFSDSGNNVEVDAKGRLHLRITKRGERWYCAEVISEKSFGYGTYRFYLDTKADVLDPGVVLGMFTWSDDPAYSHREIDIEISRWGDANNKNAQFVIQPYTRPQNIVRFQIPRRLDKTMHWFRWEPNSVSFQSLMGLNSGPGHDNAIIRKHSFAEGIPQAGDENARMNLWLINGQPPTDNGVVEIIIEKFEFVPGSG